jgi:hypothetical protein
MTQFEELKLDELDAVTGGDLPPAKAGVKTEILGTIAWCASPVLAAWAILW